MNRALVIWAISVFSGSLFAQVNPRSQETARVRIIQGPEIEVAKEHLNINNWTTTIPVVPRGITESSTMVPIHIPFARPQNLRSG